MAKIGQKIIPFSNREEGEAYKNFNALMMTYNTGVHLRNENEGSGTTAPSSVYFRDTYYEFDYIKDVSYYLTGTVDNTGDEDDETGSHNYTETISVMLANGDFIADKDDRHYQTVATLVVGPNSKVDFGITFTPNETYTKIAGVNPGIVFRINRVGIDFQHAGEETEWRMAKIENLSQSRLKNLAQSILDDFKDNAPEGYTNVIKRIGIQAGPMTKFTLGGEELMVGKRGIYETTEDLNIKNISISNPVPSNILGENIIIDYKIVEEAQ